MNHYHPFFTSYKWLSSWHNRCVRTLSTTTTAPRARGGNKRRRTIKNPSKLVQRLQQQPTNGHHRLLILGDGDFSFSVALTRQLLQLPNNNKNKYNNFQITATSLDTYKQVCDRYRKAQRNLQQLRKQQQRAVTIHHDFNATHLDGNNTKKWDSMIWNFPYPTGTGTSGTHAAAHCGQLVKHFFQSAQSCLSKEGGGRIYLTTLLRQQQQEEEKEKEDNIDDHTSSNSSKDGIVDGGSTNWDLERLAESAGLELLDCLPFSSKDYPGYTPKRSFADTTFPYYQQARTFVFGHNATGSSSSSVMEALYKEQRQQQEIFYANLQQLLAKYPDQGIYVGVLKDYYEKEFTNQPWAPDGMERIGVTLKRAAQAGVCQIEKRGPNKSSLWVLPANSCNTTNNDQHGNAVDFLSLDGNNNNDNHTSNQ